MRATTSLLTLWALTPFSPFLHVDAVGGLFAPLTPHPKPVAAPKMPDTIQRDAVLRLKFDWANPYVLPSSGEMRFYKRASLVFPGNVHQPTLAIDAINTNSKNGQFQAQVIESDYIPFEAKDWDPKHYDLDSRYYKLGQGEWTNDELKMLVYESWAKNNFDKTARVPPSNTLVREMLKSLDLRIEPAKFVNPNDILAKGERICQMLRRDFTSVPEVNYFNHKVDADAWEMRQLEIGEDQMKNLRITTVPLAESDRNLLVMQEMTEDSCFL